MTVTNATTSATSTATGTTSTGSTALTKLSGNLNDFLKMLMTQLQNQDPTAPMDTNTFTTQLVQFSSVEQQISTNTNLTALLNATQSSNLLSSSQMVGKTIEATSPQLSLQNGHAAIDFTTATAKPVNISIQNQAGVTIAESVVTSAAGVNSWAWNGQNSGGTQLPDGAYKVVVANADGSTIPFTVVGTATSVQRSGSAVSVELGSLNVDLSNVTAVTVK